MDFRENRGSAGLNLTFRKVPLIFVVHSMGGLIVKEVRRTELTETFQLESN